MMIFATLRADEIGIVTKDGKFNKLLKPGKHFINGRLKIYNTGAPFNPDMDLGILLQHQELADALLVFDLKDNEAAVYLKDGAFNSITLKEDKHAVWKGPWQQEILKFDTTEAPIVSKPVIRWIQKGYLSGHILASIVPAYHKGLLYLDHEFIRVMEPGDYYFWNTGRSVNIINVDMRAQQLDVAGQELMTRDKISLRINFVATWRVENAEIYQQSSATPGQLLYSDMQLALRDYVGSLTFEEILARKDEISGFVIKTAGENAAKAGIKILRAGVKDIILPGDIKEILNQVLVAEKKAQANIITRREETASVRNMPNAAKLMDENKTLFRLREMEHIERIAENISSIEMTSRENLLEQLKVITGAGKNE